MKTELEEAAENMWLDPIKNLTSKMSFIAGAKWQKEQDKKMYSEEEVRETVNWKAVYEESLSMQRTSNAGYESKINELKEKIKTMYSKEDMWEAYKNSNTVFDNKDSLREEFEEWFEQFKKK
jgi:hypothetical protein